MQTDNSAIIVIVALLCAIAAFIILLISIFKSVRIRANPDYYQRLMGRAEHAFAEPNAKKARSIYIQVTKGIRRVKNPSTDLLSLLGQAYLAIGNLDHKTSHVQEALQSYCEAIRYIAVPAEVVRLVSMEYAANEKVTSDAVNAYMLHIASIRNEDLVEDKVLQFLEHWSRSESTKEPAGSKAVIALNQRLIGVDPRYEWSHYSLGLALMQSGRIPEAIVAFQEAEKLVPTRPETPFNLGMLHYAQKQPDLAYKSFKRSLGLNAQQPQALYRVGALLVDKAGKNPETMQQALEEASTSLQRACELEDMRADYWYMLGHAELLRNKLDATRRAFMKAASIEPKNSIYLMALAHLLIQLNDQPAAIMALRQTLVADPKHTLAHFNLAQLLFGAGNFTESEKHYRNVQELDPKHVAAKIGLGRSLYGQERWGEAIHELRLVQDPGQEGLYALARALSRNSAFSDAITVYVHWLEVYGPEINAFFYLGCSYAHLGDWEQAIVAYEQAEQESIKQSTTRSDIALYWGLGLLQLDQLEKAQQVLGSAIAITPNDVQVLYINGLLALRKGAKDYAKELFSKILTLNPNYAPAHLALGMLDERDEAYDHAILRYTKGLGLWPEWKWAQNRLGITQAKKRDWPSAHNTLSAVTRLDATNNELLAYLGLVQSKLDRHGEALKIWQSLSGGSPQDQTLSINIAVSSYYLGRKCFEVRDYRSAIQHWRCCVQEQPNISEFRACLVEAYLCDGLGALFEGDRSENERVTIRQTLEKAVELDPVDPRSRYYLGLEALTTNNAARAIAYLQPLAHDRPRESRYTYHLALSFLLAGDAQSAMPLLDGLIPEAALYSPGLQIAAGNAAVLQNRWEDALVFYCRSLQY